MHRKYIVRLTSEECQTLASVVRTELQPFPPASARLTFTWTY